MTPKVDVQCPVDLFDREISQQPSSREPGVGHDNIDGARGLENVPDVITSGQVSDDDGGIALRRDGRKGLGLPSRDDHVGAFGGESPSDRPAKATGGTGH
jgi:hypothetical protein